MSLVVVLSTVAVNPILGRWRLLRNEWLVITGMLLILGGVATRGLNRILATTMTGLARKLSNGADLPAYVRDDGSLAWAWWPLHLIGLLLAPTWATSMIWFSFILGWI